MVNKKFNLVFASVVLVAIFMLSFLIASHVITTSSGGTNFSVDEDLTTLYNFTVNNTDAGQDANITQVNITIPDSFTFVADTNNTSALVVTFVNTTTILSWTNSTGFLINGSEAQYFWFNATAATPGTFNITVTTLNGTGGIYSSNLSVTINDTTNPTYSNNQSNETEVSLPVLFSIQYNDSYDLNTSGQYIFSTNNTGVWVNETTPANFITTPSWANVTKTLNSTAGLLIGYRWYANDSAGNKNDTEIFILTTVAAAVVTTPTTTDDDSSSGRSITFWSKGTFAINDEQFSEGYTKELIAKQRIRVNVDDEHHYVGVVSLSETSVTINVSSIPQQAILSVGDEKKFDVNDDGVYDLIVMLNSINDNFANISVKSISENVTSETIVEEEEKEVDAIGEGVVPEEVSEEESSLIWLVWLFIVLLVVVGVVLSKKRE